MIWRRSKIAICIIFCAAFGIGIAEIGYYYWILQKNTTLEKADAIVVFAGSDDRIKTGFDLVKSGLADSLVISPASEKQLKKYEDKNGSTTETRYIIENKARKICVL